MEKLLNHQQKQEQSQLYLGCAVWSYKGWVGNFYPVKTKPSNFLKLYSRQFNTVEGNTTFYAIPQGKTIAKWVSETPKEFKFCPKLPKEITHQGLLQPNVDQALNFLEIMSGLKDNLGLTFAQLPPSYSPQYLEDLKVFLRSLKFHHVALEVRHSDWFSEPYHEQLNLILQEFSLTRVLLDTRPIYNCDDDPQINSQRRKPDVPLKPIVTNNATFVRFISHPKVKYNQAYLKEWAVQVKNWLKTGITVYFFIHCPIEDYSPNTANYFKNLLQQQGVLVDSIATQSNPISNQLSLF